MKIAVFGTGGVGGYYGARLANAGEDVRFIARGAHLEAIRKNGLRVRSALGDAHVHPAHASDDPNTIGPVDLVIIAVKLYDTDAAASGCLPLLGPDTSVVSFQNGVTAAETLATEVGADRVFAGTTHILATIAAPGEIAHLGTMAKLRFGELDGRPSARVSGLLAACQRAKIDAAISDDINVDIWTKFAFIAPASGITSLLRLPLGPIREDPETRALLRAAVDEAVAVARQSGVALPDDLAETHMAMIDGLPETMGSSMLHDLTQSRRLELPWLSGTVARLGREKGVPTPTHDVIVTALKLHAGGAMSP
jgi:2-dehydropantoate 2-reductase